MEKSKRSKPKIFDPAYMTHYLEIKGAVNSPLRITAEELSAMKLTEVRDLTMICGSGRNEGFIQSYRGVLLTDLLVRADIMKGDFDLVRLTLEKIGQIVFAKIQMGPGKSASFGIVNRSVDEGRQVPIPIFALAGPPTGCLINLETLVRPALLKMLGRTPLSHPEVDAKAVDSFPKKMPFPFVKWTMLEVTEEGYQVRFSSPSAGMGILPTMATANSLTVIPHGSTIKPGDRVRVWPLDWGTQLSGTLTT